MNCSDYANEVEVSCGMTHQEPAESFKSSGAATYSLSVSRAMDLLGLFSPDKPELGVSEMSRALGLPKASVQRFVAALVRHDFLDQDQSSRKYRIGAGAFAVGSLFVNSRRLERLAEPFMHQLVEKLEHTCQLSVLRGAYMIVTASIEGPGPIKYSVPVGYQLALSTSAAGKAMLALINENEVVEIINRGGMPKRTHYSITDPSRLLEDLRATRERGYSANWEENQLGVGSVAAPIVAPDGSPSAVLSIGFPISLVQKSELALFGEAVARKAAELSRQIWHGHAQREAAQKKGDMA